VNCNVPVAEAITDEAGSRSACRRRSGSSSGPADFRSPRSGSMRVCVERGNVV
jgi:hypothetical protein